MTDSEKKAQKYLKSLHANAFIRKMPDFKQTGSMLGGLPDYLVITLNGDYIWYEIKLVSSKSKTVNLLDLFTEQQLPIFDIMYRNKANIMIFMLHKNKKYMIDWKYIKNWVDMGNIKIKIDNLSNFEVR